MSFQRFAGRLALVVSVLLLALPAMAQELYSVRGVEVEATASDASQARQAAIAMGQGRALERLWARLIPREMLQRAPALSSQQIESLIEDFSVSNEHIGESSYSAVLNVRFRPAEVRRLLRESNVPYAEQQASPLLLLPVYADSNGMRLWNSPNPWRDAWQRRDESGLVPILLPLGDLNDLSTIDAERVAALDRAALDQIASAYGADGVLVTIARLGGDPQDDTAALSIELRRFGGSYEGAMNMVSVSQQAGEPIQRFYDRAVEQVDNRIQEEWKRDNLLRFDRQQEMLVRVPLQSLPDWVQIQRRLNSTASVTGYEVRHLSREQAILALSFVGEEAALGGALMRSGLALRELQEVPPGWPSHELTASFTPSASPEGAQPRVALPLSLQPLEQPMQGSQQPAQPPRLQ